MRQIMNAVCFSTGYNNGIVYITAGEQANRESDVTASHKHRHHRHGPINFFCFLSPECCNSFHEVRVKRTFSWLSTSLADSRCDMGDHSFLTANMSAVICDQDPFRARGRSDLTLHRSAFEQRLHLKQMFLF